MVSRLHSALPTLDLLTTLLPDAGPGRNPGPRKIIARLTPFHDHLDPNLHLGDCPERRTGSQLKVRNVLLFLLPPPPVLTAQGLRQTACSPSLVRNLTVSPSHPQPISGYHIATGTLCPSGPLGWPLLVARTPVLLPSDVPGSFRNSGKTQVTSKGMTHVSQHLPDVSP